MRILYITTHSELSPENIQLLNQIAEESRNEFNVYIGKLNQLNCSNLFWWANPVSSRNIYLDKSFENFCKLKLIEKLFENNTYDKVYTNIEILYKLLVIKYGDQRVVKKRFYYISHKLFYSINVIIRLIGYQLFKYLSIKVLTFFFCVRSSNNKILVETFVYRNSFNGDFSDRHFPHLQSYLEPEVFKNSSYFPNFYGIKNFLKVILAIKNSKLSFTLAELHIGFFDFLRCVFYFVNPRNSCYLRIIDDSNYDLSELINYSYHENFISIDTSNSLIRFFSIKGMHRSGNSIEIFLMWFENISINKITKIALSRFFPQARCIGYQGIYTSPNSIGNYVIKEEAKCNVLPDVIGFMGNKLVTGKNICYTTIMPAFRYLNVLKSKKYYFNFDNDSVNILVALPISKIESINLIRFIHEYKNELGLKFYFKVHPASDKRKMEAEMYKLGFLGDQIVDTKTELMRYRVVVTTGSGIAIESLLKCVPVVIVGSKINLTLNPIPINFVNRYWKLVFDQDQFKIFIEFIFSERFDKKSFINEMFKDRDNICTGLKESKSIFTSK